MAAQRGKDLLIKLDMTGAGDFETVAGLRATRIAFNAETVDVTNLGSAGRWRELLVGRGGAQSAAISGSGVFRDEATDERARAIFFAGEIPAFQVIMPDFGVIEGPFQITSIEYSGSHDGEAVYELALASAGARELRGDLMANPWRGEVELVVDGEPRVMRLTLAALAELEARLKSESLVELIARFEAGGVPGAGPDRAAGRGAERRRLAVSEAELVRAGSRAGRWRRRRRRRGC